MYKYFCQKLKLPFLQKEFRFKSQAKIKAQ